MIELIYQQPGLTIFIVLWISGILNKILRQDDDLIGVSIVYTVLYGMYKIFTLILD